MKTVVIYDQCCEEPLSFYVMSTKESIKRFDGCYMNTELPKGVKQKDFDKMMQLIFDGKLKKLRTFPVEEVVNGAEVITVGFPP